MKAHPVLPSDSSRLEPEYPQQQQESLTDTEDLSDNLADLSFLNSGSLSDFFSDDLDASSTAFVNSLNDLHCTSHNQYQRQLERSPKPQPRRQLTRSFTFFRENEELAHSRSLQYSSDRSTTEDFFRLMLENSVSEIDFDDLMSLRLGSDRDGMIQAHSSALMCCPTRTSSQNGGFGGDISSSSNTTPLPSMQAGGTILSNIPRGIIASPFEDNTDLPQTAMLSDDSTASQKLTTSLNGVVRYNPSFLSPATVRRPFRTSSGGSSHGIASNQSRIGNKNIERRNQSLDLDSNKERSFLNCSGTQSLYSIIRVMSNDRIDTGRSRRNSGSRKSKDLAPKLPQRNRSPLRSQLSPRTSSHSIRSCVQ